MFHVIYSCDQNSSIPSSVSHDLSKIILICWYAAQTTFIIIVNIENRYYSCDKHNIYLFLNFIKFQNFF